MTALTPITAEDLLAPQGPVQHALFPGVDRLGLLAQFGVTIDRAYADPRVAALTDDDTRHRGARALALYFAYDAVYQRMLAEPLTVTQTEKGSHGYSMAQLTAMRDLRDGYLAELTSLTPVAAGVVDVGTRGVRSRFGW